MKHIMCFGDSNTFGTDPVHGGRHPLSVRWTGVLAALLGEEYRVIEEGMGGRTTVWEDQAEPYRCGRNSLIPCIASHNPLDLILIMLGTNDLKHRFGLTTWDLKNGMEQLIKMIRDYPFEPVYQRPGVLIVSPVLIREGIENSPFGCFGKEAAKMSEAFGKVYQEAARENDCGFFDAASVAEASEEDRLHMNGENHRRLAEALAPVVGELTRR